MIAYTLIYTKGGILRPGGDILFIIKWKSDWWSIEVVIINHGISHHDVDGGGGAVSQNFQISGNFPKWSDMASKVVR